MAKKPRSMKTYMRKKARRLATKRKLPPIEDTCAGDEFIKKLVDRADAHNGPYPLWHGWALMDAFLAGIEHGRRTLR